MDNWEIEWGTSMMKHGADLGTMEFIFAKGGDMGDVNYVMFDVNDSSYEPLIKAVAERENSHPDIIRKQAAFNPNVMPADMNPAVAVGNTAAVRGQSVRAGDVRGTNRALNAAAAGQRVRDADAAEGQSPAFGDLAQAGLYGRAAGAAGRAAGRNVAAFGRSAAEKARGFMGAGMNAGQRMMQSGAGQRMKNFMSGAGRTVANLRELPGAIKEVGGKAMQNREDEGRRAQIEADESRRKRSIDSINRETGGKGAAFDQRMDAYDRSPLAQRAEAQQGELTDLNDRLRENRVGVRDIFSTMGRMGDDRRKRKATPAEEARAFREGDETTAEVEQNLNQNPQAEEAVRGDDAPDGPNDFEDFSDLDLGGPETETPPMVSPQPIAAEPEEPFLSDDIYQPGTSRKKARGLEGDFRNLPEKDRTYDRLSQMMGKRGLRSNLVEALAQKYGLTPAQAQNVKQQADSGNPEAQEMVQVAMEDDPNAAEDFSDLNLEETSAEDLVQFSQDNHTTSWDSLLKNLDIR